MYIEYYTALSCINGIYQNIYMILCKRRVSYECVSFPKMHFRKVAFRNVILY